MEPRWKEEEAAAVSDEVHHACGGHGRLHPVRQTQRWHSPSALAGMPPLPRALLITKPDKIALHCYLATILILK